MSTMKAWRAHAYGENGNPADTIAKLTLDEVPVPQPGAGQLQIKVAFAAVNPIDWKLFSGGMHGICPVSFPYTPGFDLSGTVSAVGAGVTGFAVGDAVAGDIGLVESCKDPGLVFTFTPRKYTSCIYTYLRVNTARPSRKYA